MKKKFLALVLTLAMVLSLVPVTALATDGAPTPDVVDGYYNNDNQWVQGEQARSDELQDTVTTVNKKAEKVADQDNQYEVTLTVEMKQKKTAVPPGAAATVLVIDTSNSMNKQTQCNKDPHVHDSNCYTREACTQENHPRHYWWDYWENEYKHYSVGTSCRWDRENNRYVYQRLTCNKEEHQHNNCGPTTRIAAAKVAAENFLNSYRGGTVSEDGRWTPSATSLNRYVSIVSFNKYVSKNDWEDVSTQEGYNAAIASINALSAFEGTNLDAGLRMANAQLKNNTVKNMPASVVVLTDGKPTYHLEMAKNQHKNSDVEIEGVKYSVKGNGSKTSNDTYTQTVATATPLKQAASVYTVCFGASNENLEAKDKPTVSGFLITKIATQAEGKTYAYDANDTTDLYKAFAAISSSVVSGLNTGTVEDALPAGVSCTQDGIFDDSGRLTWKLDPEQATERGPDEEDFITYTYEKKYTVKIDPTAEGLNVVEGGYVPLNQPTKLTVKDSDNQDVAIPFPIPAGKVTYSLTGFEKALVTNQNKPDGLTIPSNVTIPANTTDPVTVGENGVTLLYKITVKGNAGAKFTVRDDGATLVSPKDNSITEDTENSTFSGTVDSTGTTVFYVSKHFNIDADTESVSNTATIAPGDNAEGPKNKEQTVTTTVTEAKPQTYTVTYRWADGEKPSDADTLLPQGGTFTVGQKHTVADIPQSSVVKNAAGKTGTWSCAWDRSGTIEGTANQEIVITGTWTFTETVAPKGTLTVTKKVDGRTLDQLDQDKFKITVKGPGGYTNDLTLTQADNNITEGATTATWTISNLPTGTYTVSEENAGVDGYTYTATYSATNGATVIVNSDAIAVQNQPATDAQTVIVTKEQTSTMTVTNKYKKQEVVPTPDTSKPDVNKTATDLVNDKTDVTLSVGGKSAKENVAVMFLLDKSTSQGVRDEAAKMLDELATKTNTNIMYDVVIFSGTASSSGWQDIQDSTTLDAIKDNFVGSNPTDGTNMSAGILKAKSDIASLKNTHKEYTETYLITLSDGITYVWSEVDQGKVYCIPVSATGNSDSESSTQNAVDTWDMMYDYGKSLEEVYGGVPQFLSAIQSKITQTKNDSHVQEYPSLQNPIDTYIYDAEKTKETTDKYACGPEAAMYYSITGYEQLAKEFTKTFAYALPELNKETREDNVTNWTRFPWGREVMEYCKSISFNKDWDGNVSNTNPGKIFSGIKDVIYYEIQSGSITDVIGADFSLTDQTLTQNTFTLTVNGNPVVANTPTSNVITFGEKDESTGKYPYVLTYYKGTAIKNADNTYTITSSDGNTTYTYTPCDKTGEVNGSVSDEFFVLKMNVPVVSLDLTYNLSLTSKRTAAGTYEVPTNESATLAYKSANQNSGTVDFNEPTVSYTVKGSAGGHGGNGGGTVTIPDDVPTGLNGKDHYAYVVGYPDGMVYPQKNITRAEVATIFFRLLKDETREANMTKSNGYNDMKDGAWYTCAVSTLSKMGIIKGYEDGSFKPDASISRAEFAAIAARFDPDGDKTPATFSDVSSHWAKDEISIAANHGWIKGYEDGSFKPDQKITRAETMTLVNRVLKRLPETKDDLHKDMKTWPDNQNESAWFYLAVQEATNSHYQNLKKDGTHEKWESMRETRDWAALEK